MAPVTTRRCQSSGTSKKSSGRVYNPKTPRLHQSGVNTDSSDCSNPGCGKSVKNGIECTHCKCWFHAACTSMDPKIFQSHRQDAGKPWLCNKCLSNPLIHTVTTITSYYELKLSTCLVEISNLRSSLESLKTQIPNLPPPTPATRSKRPHTRDSPTQDGQPGEVHNVRPTIDLSKTRGIVNPPKPSCTIRLPDILDEPTQAPSVTNTLSINSDAKRQKESRGRNAASQPLEVNNRKTPTTSGYQRETKTIICTKFPEPTGTSIAARREEELHHWNNLCKLMGTSVNPISLTRLSRKPESAHAGEPRLLRVTLRTMSDVETILLASHILKDDVDTRIHPDIPWSTRSSRKNLDPQQARADKNARTILIHGVPELGDDDYGANHLHDCSEWSYIQSTLNLDGVLATDVFRLPRSPAYKGQGPRILKVTLLTDTMLADTLDLWYSCKHLLPEIRIRPHLTTSTSTETRPATQPTTPSMVSSPSNPQNHCTNLTKPKNLPSPVRGIPASQ